MATIRTYIVTPKGVPANELEPTDVRLIKAGSPAAALKHVSDELNVSFAAQDDLIDWLPRGVKVEDAGKPNGADENPSTT